MKIIVMSICHCLIIIFWMQVEMMSREYEDMRKMYILFLCKIG